jgi:predicted esterase
MLSTSRLIRLAMVAVVAILVSLPVHLVAVPNLPEQSPADPAAPPAGQGRGGSGGAVDPRVRQRAYLFSDTNEQLPFALFVSSKVRKDKKAPLIVALHGLGGTQNTMVNPMYRAVEFAEQGGYILVAPMGYNSSGWYGIPEPPARNDGRAAATAANAGRGVGVGAGGTAVTDPGKARELSEKDVLNVLAMMRKEFNVDEKRTYLMGHSMGGAGTIYLGVKHASNWAAIAAIAPASGGLLPDNYSLASARKLPVIIVQGDADTAVPVARTRQWVEKLKEQKMTHEYHEIPGGTHGSVIATGMPDIFAFFAVHTR